MGTDTVLPNLCAQINAHLNCLYTTFLIHLGWLELTSASRLRLHKLSLLALLFLQFQIRNRLREYGVDPYDLSIIEHSCNPPDEDTLDININPTTFTAGSIAGVVRTAGDKLGDGIEAAAEGASSLYNRFYGSSINASVKKDREEVSNDRHNPSNDVEWLP
jgi:hypothetical protein